MAVIETAYLHAINNIIGQPSPELYEIMTEMTKKLTKAETIYPIIALPCRK